LTNAQNESPTHSSEQRVARGRLKIAISDASPGNSRREPHAATKGTIRGDNSCVGPVGIRRKMFSRDTRHEVEGGTCAYTHETSHPARQKKASPEQTSSPVTSAVGTPEWKMKEKRSHAGSNKPKTVLLGKEESRGCNAQC